ncbi:dTDP-glucose 4,6-dehydratase [Halorhodospira halochloris]|uniref:dTDP-glucose 4,6-dehydratase n=1 Tax=Halorhodospira halochloris TaxID=1052 RepID=A0A110B480_HALHR|nr:NAD-dependent epimerase [Halorhodospira halochloris]MBK1652484.1 capsular biosynthesis protein CpsI [Halorhodospira halochloris]MCG5547442.1 NAD-dependent epimerase [Halorhodospira halochloris]BAU56380.1 dTDP-glucose 4,6-dehydratase [Halorhodospira halochloris]
MRVLVTGAAGFIGMHVAQRLLAEGVQVVGLDNLNDYYDVALKNARVAELEQQSGDFYLARIDLADASGVEAVFRDGRFDRVIHLAAQAGVRYSLENPRAYVDSNLVGFCNILEGCRHHGIEHLVYASSSSVYGANTRMPFSVHDNVDHPVSLYAATKKSNELMAHTYAHLYGLPVTGLRFFTVYGPWGRPDMAPFKFTRAVLSGEPIDVYNYGNMRRDFSYIDDVTEGVLRVAEQIPGANPSFSTDAPDPASSFAPYRLYNIGNNSPVALNDFIGVIEKICGRTAQRNLMPMQPGDVEQTYADIGDLYQATGWRPTTTIEDGMASFIKWYRDFYNA